MAIWPAKSIKWPKISWSSSVASDNLGITFFGIINKWVGACGLISFITIDISSSYNISAGISLLIAALSAKGTSIIHNIEQIDRGYENIDERLRLLGASIERV